jgi:hypothetical protein
MRTLFVEAEMAVAMRRKASLPLGRVDVPGNKVHHQLVPAGALTNQGRKEVREEPGFVEDAHKARRPIVLD